MSTPPGSAWEVFVRPRRGLAHQHVGSVRGSDPEMALAAARDLFTRRGEWVSVWVVRAADLHAAVPQERDGFFGNAEGKPFRAPEHYVELSDRAADTAGPVAEAAEPAAAAVALAEAATEGAAHVR